MEPNRISNTSSTIFRGAFSTKVDFLASKSRALTCSHIIAPVVLVCSSKETCRGKPFVKIVLDTYMVDQGITATVTASTDGTYTHYNIEFAGGFAFIVVLFKAG